MNQLYAGYARVNITPKLGIGLSGYYVPRKAEKVLDELELSVLSLSISEKRTVLISVDIIGIRQEFSRTIRQAVSRQCGVPFEGIFLHATHIHTGPFTFNGTNEDDPVVGEYSHFLLEKTVEAVREAIADEKKAMMGIGTGIAPNISFIRRFRMKDGSIRTNPGANNPDILHPIGRVDDRVHVVRFDQENGKSLVLVNFACHPDVIGGNHISADWPGFVRRTVEKTLDDTSVIFFNGAQGDVNHVNVHPEGGFLNDTFRDFDDVFRGYGHAKYMARVVTGGVLQAYDKVAWQEVESLSYGQRLVKIPSQMPKPSVMEQAHRIHALHEAGKDDQIPFQGMMLTTVVAEAARMVRLEHGPESFEMAITAVRVGNVALAGFPGEPFSGIGWAIKETSGFAMVIPTCLTNGHQGYFPMKEAYDEGGYEARSSNFQSGVAETMIAEMQALLKSL